MQGARRKIKVQVREKINECMVQAANANAKVKQVNKFGAYAKYKCKKCKNKRVRHKCKTNAT